MIKAIETRYRGFRFRSRLEARWGVFLDGLGVPWEYEKEGFELGDGVRYLPDFWLPTLRSWLEIKGPEPDDTEIDKAVRLHRGSGYPVYMFVGEHTNPPHEGRAYLSAGGSGEEFGNPCWWGISNSGPVVDSETDCVLMPDGKHERRVDANPRHPLIIRAFGLARAARFEFGR